MEWMIKPCMIRIVCLIPLAVTGCKGAAKKETAIDDRALARAAEHFGVDPGGIDGSLTCENPKGGGRVYATHKRDVKDGASATIILSGGRAYGPGDEGYGLELAFAACGIRDRLPGEALLAARVFFALGGQGARHESVVETAGAMEPAEDGANPHAPALSIIEGGWNLTFWTDDTDACTYRRFKVFVYRSGTVELDSAESHTYPCH